jgi:hypothetical protein
MIQTTANLPQFPTAFPRYTTSVSIPLRNSPKNALFSPRLATDPHFVAQTLGSAAPRLISALPAPQTKIRSAKNAFSSPTPLLQRGLAALANIIAVPARNLYRHIAFHHRLAPQARPQGQTSSHL